jgi:hypothetical protein
MREETNAHEHRHPRTRYGTIHPKKVYTGISRALIGRLTSKIEVATRDWGEGRERERREDARTHHVSRARKQDGFERAAVRWVSKMITRREARGEGGRRQGKHSAGRVEGGQTQQEQKKEREGIKSVCGTVGRTSQLSKPSAGRRKEGKTIARPSLLHFLAGVRCHLQKRRDRQT